MPYPPGQPVVPLGEGLLDPLHNNRKLQPTLRLDIKGEPVILKPQIAHRKYEPKLRLKEDPVKERQGLRAAEQRFPIVDLGADLIPHPLS
jgi:hypothetical protein